MVKKTMMLKLELEFEHEEQLKLALESFAVVLQNWDNHFKDNPKNKIRYFVQETE